MTGASEAPPVASASLVIFQFQEKGAQLRVIRIEGGQLAGMPQRRGKIAFVTRDRDKRSQDLTVSRMLPMGLFQHR